LSRQKVQELGLTVDELECIYPGDTEKSQDLQDAVLSVLHMLTHTFVMAPQANKIIENHMGKAFITQANVPMPVHRMPMPMPVPFMPNFPGMPPVIQPQPQQAPAPPGAPEAAQPFGGPKADN